MVYVTMTAELLCMASRGWEGCVKFAVKHSSICSQNMGRSPKQIACIATIPCTFFKRFDALFPISVLHLFPHFTSC